jgi:hypothetical protein
MKTGIRIKKDGDGIAIICDGKKYVRETPASAIECATKLIEQNAGKIAEGMVKAIITPAPQIPPGVGTTTAGQ